MIKLTFLGTKAEVEIPQEGHDDPQCREARRLGEGYYHRLHSSLLIEAEGKKLMLDAGEGHEETVARVKPDAILVTHAHPDHLSRKLEAVEPAVPVYMSEDTAEVVKLPNEQVFARDNPFEVGGFKVVAHAVVHSLVAPAVCFKVSKGNFTLVYAPDVLSIPDREDFLKGVDLYIGDGSSLTRDIIRRKDDKLIGHASMLRQLRWAEGTKQVLFTHVGHLKKTEADVNQALRIASDGKAKLAQDGTSLEFESLQVGPVRLADSDAVLGEPGEGVTTETISPMLAPAFPGEAEPEEAEVQEEELVRQPFGSQAGKTRLAARIVKMIPPHETYVEPFAGGAAVFWAKEPAEKEVLNDRDPEIAFAYRFIKGLTEEQLRRLRRYDWRRTRPLFQKLKDSNPSDEVERFRKFYYLAKASFGESRQTFGNEGSDIDVEKLPAASERLKNVTILNQDFEPVVQRYDSVDTFFYLDPPYPGRSFKGEFQFNLEDLDRLVKALKGIKGRFILSLGAEHRKYLPASWWTKKVLVRRMLWLPQTDKRLPPNYELLAANFTPSKESLEALEAELDEASDEEIARFPEVEDFMVVPDFISLVGSAVTGEEPQDLDVLIRSAVRSESLEVAVRKQLDPEKRGYLHFIYEPAGPHDDYIPLWDLVALKKPEAKVVEVGLAKGLAPGRPFTPLKTAGGYGELEFSVDAADKLWETWGQGYAEAGLVVQEKFDGYRLTLHRKGDRVFAFSEDAKRDIVDDLPGVGEDLQALPDGDFILDSELLLYAEEAVTLNNPYEPGDKIERMDMASFLGKEPAGKFRAVCQVFDCLYLDGEDLHSRPQTERLEALHKLLNPLDALHLKEVESRLVHTREEFLKAVKGAASMPHSEGAMVKVSDSDYPLTGRSSKIAKLKNFKEIRGRVVEKQKTGAGAYVYDIALSDGSVIGSTYATKLEADVGDILEVRAAEVKVKEEDGKKVFTWDNPIVASIKPRGTALTTPEQAEAMARKRRGPALSEANGMAIEDEGETRSEAAEKFWGESWHKSFPPSGRGEFVYHHHWRGLSEEETKLSEEKLLNTEHSVHGDLRFQFSEEALFGFTVFLGATEEVQKAGGDRLVNLPPDDKLQGAWKLSQPAAWLKVAREKPLVTAPGEVGATSDKYSKFFAEDWGTYEIGVWREHFFELFLDGRKLKGRYTIQYAPVGGRRVWLIGRPKDQTPYAEANKLDDVVKELKSKGQRYLVWAMPGEKPKLVEVGKLALRGGEGAEQLTCPKCGEALEPGATRLAKLSNDFHDVFRCPGCKHIFSPADKEESRLSAASPLG